MTGMGGITLLDLLNRNLDGAMAPACAILQRRPGSQHLDAAACLDNLARVLFDRGEVAEG
ncbi:MAG TPA: hypothetical protein VHP35_07575 [Terriglobia bacterium]|jgi:hypothetical protein|nr:hypothetical protein [Terriglobia bacterium]